MKKRLTKKIKSFDQFGHGVNLNFSQHKGTFNSLPGGIFSILIRILYVYLTTWKFYQMIFYLDDQIQNY